MPDLELVMDSKGRGKTEGDSRSLSTERSIFRLLLVAPSFCGICVVRAEWKKDVVVSVLTYCIAEEKQPPLHPYSRHPCSHVLENRAGGLLRPLRNRLAVSRYTHLGPDDLDFVQHLEPGNV